MKSFQYVIQDEQGIHARPAGMLVKEAAKYASAITVKANEKTGDAKRLFAVMGMAITKGTEVTIEAEGEDEDAAVVALETFFKENL